MYWSKNAALFERLMEIHSNPPIIYYTIIEDHRGHGLWCPFDWPSAPLKITVSPRTFFRESCIFLDLPICAVLIKKNVPLESKKKSGLADTIKSLFSCQKVQSPWWCLLPKYNCNQYVSKQVTGALLVENIVFASRLKINMWGKWKWGWDA